MRPHIAKLWESWHMMLYTYTHTCVYICVRVRLHAYITYSHIHTHFSIYIYKWTVLEELSMCMYTNACMDACMHTIHTYKPRQLYILSRYTCMHVCLWVYMYMCVCIYRHTYNSAMNKDFVRYFRFRSDFVRYFRFRSDFVCYFRFRSLTSKYVYYKCIKKHACIHACPFCPMFLSL
jgi:hypothetical protein